MYSEITLCAINAAIKAGTLLKHGLGTSFEISSKEGKNNLVTEYDKKAEQTIIEHIKNAFPTHSFLAEESGKSGIFQSDEIHWIIDPLDGTVNFAHSLPVFCVSIAAVVNDEIISGVIYQPILEELFIAEKGIQTRLNDKSIKVSDTEDFESSFLVTGFPYNVNENPSKCIDTFVDVIQRGIPIRRLGSAALDLAYTACGRFDGFWEVNLNPWDVAAGSIIVKEAGGTVTQYDNSNYTINDDSILATNGIIHEKIVDLLKCYCNI